MCGGGVNVYGCVRYVCEVLCVRVSVCKECITMMYVCEG